MTSELIVSGHDPVKRYGAGQAPWRPGRGGPRPPRSAHRRPRGPEARMTSGPPPNHAPGMPCPTQR